MQARTGSYFSSLATRPRISSAYVHAAAVHCPGGPRQLEAVQYVMRLREAWGHGGLRLPSRSNLLEARERDDPHSIDWVGVGLTETWGRIFTGCGGRKISANVFINGRVLGTILRWSHKT